MSIRRDKKAKRQPTWVLDFLNENGIRKRVRTHSTRSVAETKLGLILSEVEKRKMGLSNGNNYIMIEELVTKYILASEVDGKSPLTIERIRNVTDAFMRIVGNTIIISEITSEVIEEFKQIRLTQKTPKNKYITKGGLNVELRHLKALFNWSYKREFINRSPFIGVKMVKAENKPVRFLSSAELTNLFTQINLANDLDTIELFTFYLQTGARRSEALPPKFTWADVDLNASLISLNGKFGKRRTLPLSSSLYDILERRKIYDYPFDLTVYQASNRAEKYFELAKIDNASLHTLRKTCGSILIQEGLDIYRVSKWLGHSSVAVTEKHYVDLLQSEYEDIAYIIAQATDKYLLPEKVVPYMCHNTDQNRPIETNSVEETEIAIKSQMTGKSVKTKAIEAIKRVLPVGIEPTTYGLRVRRKDCD